MSKILIINCLLIFIACTNKNANEVVYIQTNKALIEVVTKHDVYYFDKLLNATNGDID